MMRSANPPLSSSGEAAVAQYREVLWEQEDLTNASRRNYLSDLRHFIAWYEANIIRETSEVDSPQTEFAPQAITTPALTRYRSYLQMDLHQKPNSVNRALISIKRYFGWAMQEQLIFTIPRLRLNWLVKKSTLPATWKTRKNKHWLQLSLMLERLETVP